MDIQLDVVVVGGRTRRTDRRRHRDPGRRPHPGARGPPAGRTCPDHRAGRVHPGISAATPSTAAGPGGRVLADVGVDPVRLPAAAGPLPRARGTATSTGCPPGPDRCLRTSLLGTRSKARAGAASSPGSPAWTPRHWRARRSGHGSTASTCARMPRPWSSPCSGSGPTAPTSDELGADAALAQLQLGRVRRRPLPRRRVGPAHRCAVGRHRGPDRRPRSGHIDPAAGRLGGRRGRRTASSPGRSSWPSGRPPPPGRSFPIPRTGATSGAPVTAACLDLGVRRPPQPGYVLGIDEPLYATTQGPPARQAPAGQAVVAVLRYGARSAERGPPGARRPPPAGGVSDDDVLAERFLASMTVAGTVPRADGRGAARTARRSARPAPRASTWPATGSGPTGCWPTPPWPAGTTPAGVRSPAWRRPVPVR